MHLVYVRDWQSIVRTRLPSGLTTVLDTFASLNDMACFTVSPHGGRWYFHYEFGSQFGLFPEAIGYADASFVLPPPKRPVLQVSLQAGNLLLSWPAEFSGTVEGTDSLSSPLRWQPLVPQPPVLISNGNAVVTLTNATGRRFYRLQLPQTAGRQ